MAITTTWCPVLQANVTMVATFEDEVTILICPEFEPLTKTCRLKKMTGLCGPLSQLLERVLEGTLANPAPRCQMA
jgi:hypothetical protein